MFFRLGILSLFLFSFSFGDWIVKIGSKSYPESDFQDFVDYTRYVFSISGQTLKTDEEAKMSLLKQFIDNELVLTEAKKKGIDGETNEIKTLYQEELDRWLVQVYLASHLNVKNVSPSESEIKSEFEKLKASGILNIPANAKYGEIDESVKAQVAQKLYMEKVNKIKDSYREEEEKKFKVKRNGLESVYVAVVNGERVARSEVDEILKQQLDMAGYPLEELKKNKKDYDRYRDLVLNDLILNKILKIKMDQEKFSSKREIQLASGFMKKQVILQYFLKKEIYDKIKIGDSEKDAFYRAHKNELKDKPFDKVNEFIESSLRQEKARSELMRFIEEKRDAYSVQRNFKELGTIKF